MPRSIFAIVASHIRLREVLQTFEKTGFRKDDISVVLPDQRSSPTLFHERSSKAPEGAVAGGLTGAGLGGLLGLLAGIGVLAIPGVGAFIAAGPILATLSGAAVGAAAGGLTGSLIGLGLPEYEAKRYETHLRGGGILISVHTQSTERIGRAKSILVGHGATDIVISSEEFSEEDSSRRGRRRPRFRIDHNKSGDLLEFTELMPIDIDGTTD
jgi:hypothetical protein